MIMIQILKIFKKIQQVSAILYGLFDCFAILVSKNIF